MTRNQYLKVQARKANQRQQKVKSQARETMRILKDIKPELNYTQALVGGYIANGNCNLIVNKHNI